MELKEKITLDMLTKDSVSVLRQQFLTCLLYTSDAADD